ncbi:sigma-54-dependent Fis family transcriptional regulator [Vibrio natriegens]|uniref:Sigma-54-dependent Fis family transcriptional regulator n=1 Tax=Vibrio natriegens NBRC 15636 = ATCC 14048 = DSM 759 TaxID=1219067 RepID=A0AAN0Y287_VIBNA|nr:sigma-54-dependent Fis family transcriptional regulator [Vibrio natriegens]ALR15424.1 Fis family transcriptional regulator [Vibrio natriegens NBRC 15636 = ATCC 14048 = DSM 759]ANQ12717.1 sigma-54-dependent Fis family transcriptional regulator [Vibrio natriegens NBRC 15636 = ATCC 14048 = DSM 759]EPM38323.1 Fis family transcriptional regulator [Vibrio natriegens NBRC 15636 = ATCC 14048 = DSM 759]MDX6027115.1 sigma-54-dependent Fis family transcriptional regulator [Vibrio natriegens NBRC 15636 
MEIQPITDNNWLSTSWLRSEQAGLKQRRLPEDVRVNSATLKDRRHQLNFLLDAVKQFALPLFNQIFAHSNSRLILTDADGVIIGSWGKPRFREKLTEIALSSGACWQEKLKGTNAIGTALIEAKPVSVIGDQHFIQHHRFISCSANPIFDHLGRLLGVLDITSEQEKHDLSTQVLVQNMVQLVENQMLNQIPCGHIRVDLACDKNLLNSGWQGIIIADEAGEILAHNQVASQLLDRSTVVGQSLEEILAHQNSDQPIVFKTAPLSKTKIQSRSLSASNDLHFGDSKVEHCWQQANRVIDKDISLLILGETGVGKNEFVKALHKNSQRKSGPLVAVNCGALPKDLIESELFGYVAGAFTGANSKGYQGKIRQAHKGTLFLDEIADLPIAAQSRLLHVLQDKTVLPVGSNQSVQVDTQIIAATHKDLEALVEQGEFRQDLYYRLNGLIIELPRLEERQDKQKLIESLHRRHAEPNQHLCPHLLSLLLSYSWPGNLRELDSLIKVSALMAQGEAVLELAHVPTHLSKKLSQIQQQASAEPTTDIRTTVEDKLVKTYQANQGNISKTSRMLGVSRNTIYRKLKSMGMIK